MAPRDRSAPIGATGGAGRDPGPQLEARGGPDRDLGPRFAPSDRLGRDAGAQIGTAERPISFVTAARTPRKFLQSDASNVYDILDRGPPSDKEQEILLVGCWAHARRYFFDAAICKYPIGVEGLTRIRAIYVADGLLAKLPPVDRARERVSRVLPLVDSFFTWVRGGASNAGTQSRHSRTWLRDQSGRGASTRFPRRTTPPRQHEERASIAHDRGG